MAACTLSIHVFLGRPLSLLSSGVHSIINVGILSSGSLLTWPHRRRSLFVSMTSVMFGFLSLARSPLNVHFLFFLSLIFLQPFLAHHFL
jgi:hypothetical protein